MSAQMLTPEQRVAHPAPLRFPVDSVKLRELGYLIRTPQPGMTCHNKDQDPEEFFPFPSQEHLFTRLCDGCPLITECLHYACRHGLRGVWGGTTEEQRRDLVRDWKAAGWVVPS